MIRSVGRRITSSTLFAAVVLTLPCWGHEGAVTTGSDPGARAYYAKMAARLGTDLTVGATSLDDLLAFAGYPASASKLEALDSSVLLDPALASSCDAGLCLPATGLGEATLRSRDILVTRFFAPKIVNVNVPVPQPGWRKLARLRVRPDSAAARKGIESVIILFNSFSDAGQVPFPSHSVNTQVMLIAPSQQPIPPETQPQGLIWLDFGPDQKLTTALVASFDAADLTNDPKGTRSYFVPDGCNDCHGSPGGLKAPMVNYLDTDHWFDRLDTDFQELRDAGTALLFDANSNDPSTKSYQDAFDVIREFNEEALQQNSLAHPSSFETAAARTWLTNHQTSGAHVPVVARAFATDGGAPWQPSEEAGLAMLNRFCFRCHGSVYFSVFDRPAVVARAGSIRARINPNPVQAKKPGFKMPPDRSLDHVLTPEQINDLDTFLSGVK